MKNQKFNIDCPFEIGPAYKNLFRDTLLFLSIVENEIFLIVDKSHRFDEEWTIKLLHDNEIKKFVYHKHITFFNNIEKYFEKVVDKQ